MHLAIITECKTLYNFLLFIFSVRENNFHNCFASRTGKDSSQSQKKLFFRSSIHYINQIHTLKALSPCACSRNGDDIIEHVLMSALRKCIIDIIILCVG
jgi:hypothetical protein